MGPVPTVTVVHGWNGLHPRPQTNEIVCWVGSAPPEFARTHDLWVDEEVKDYSPLTEEDLRFLDSL